MTTERDRRSSLGELMIVGVPGTSMTPEVEAALRRIGPSGVIFFAPNFESADGAARYARAVHRVLGTGGRPALVCADEEGGMVSQLSGFWEGPPSARAVASSGGPPLVRDLAARVARRLLALGVNLNFAPCVDIHSNPANPVIGIRSFGTTPSQVGACGRAAIEGMQSVGVVPVAKHFPGHGDTSLDSHVVLPRVDAPAGTLALRELKPFEAAIQAAVPVVMTCHISVPALEPGEDRPATFSHGVVTGVLRERLGFGGVVVTDALEMAGATSVGSFGEAAVQAIEAGCDLLLYSKLEPGPEEAMAAIDSALKSGRISVGRIESSLERVRRLRAGSAAVPRAWSDAVEREARDLIPPEELDRIAVGAIRLVRRGAGGLPLRPPIHVLEVNRPASRKPIAELLRGLGAEAREVTADAASWPARLEGSALLTLTARASLNESDERSGREWLRRYPAAITVAGLNPHVADSWPEVGTLLATFDNTPASRRAVAGRLVGTASRRYRPFPSSTPKPIEPSGPL